MITVLSAAVFVFVGVDSNHFRYVRDVDVTVQSLVGDVPGDTADSRKCHPRCVCETFP